MTDASDIQTDTGWQCAICEQPTTDRPCPTHQPTRHAKTEETKR